MAWHGAWQSVTLFLSLQSISTTTVLPFPCWIDHRPHSSPLWAFSLAAFKAVDNSTTGIRYRQQGKHNVLALG
ncbi:hypothetical protein B0H65DRAFT_468257 [Neurospora tetraspora]|uniref:Secreted protein n=1 Tax=Neurospora tetraspora TaxID=94610 RepID=A0AAE0JC71_9PEZI|nr:hypothetical protein B0H65DRAFT_468257 [Neurospora tetraspora]